MPPGSALSLCLRVCCIRVFATRAAVSRRGSVEECMCGDADRNGILNVADAVYLISFIFGCGPTPAGCKNGGS